MRIQTKHKVASIRFRRWSRVGYAIFSSLKKNVTIGAIGVEISDKSLQKSTTTCNVAHLNSEYEANSPDTFKDLSEIEFALAQFNALALVDFSATEKIVCTQDLLYFNF